jgi:predicted nucleic acid-binding protein
VSVFLDASVIVPAFVQEASTNMVKNWLRTHADTLVISDFVAGEVSSAIARRVRMRVINAAGASALLAAFDVWRAEFAADLATQPQDITAATSLVRRFELKLRLPDAIHLAACLRAGLTLATLDAGLVAAAHALHLPSQLPA